MVDLDRTRMRQVIANLVENAFHHTPAGGSVTLELRKAESGDVQMTVADTGRGIPEAELPKIFDQFYRVDPSRARTTGGAGLGLTIVRRLVEAHGGKIEVTSAVGAGTTFTITLPASDSGE
jgi:two-component system sensor histidine kinase BaeS